MGDFAGPSFSLGLDLDLEESPPLPNESSTGDEDFELETLDLDLDLDLEPQPPILKRLKRGPPPPTTTQSCIKSVDVDVDVDVDDEIEDISSPEKEEDRNRTPASFHAFTPLTTRLTTNSKPNQSTQPLTNLHLLDSDSDSDDSDPNNLNLPATNRINIPTPALDQFCEDYFNNTKHKPYDQENTITPPAYYYYYHHDPRIPQLLSHRLPHFSPHITQTHPLPHPADIDYMSQFTQTQPTSRNQSLQGINFQQSNCHHLSQISGTWVNPKARTTMFNNAAKSQARIGASSSVGPKNAGKRRVRADSRSSGSWYTGEDGRKVYVSKNGRELMGQIAYRHYRKESGTGFKKSRKRVASRKSKR